jgi:MerR family transcriptional regulator, light-induced transcriptional regulator
VSPELLRAWESRYRLVEPVRSPGGFRLYTPEDESCVRRMQGHLAHGLSAAEAARLARAAAGRGSQEDPGPAATVGLSDLVRRLADALERFDESTGQAVLDRMFVSFSLETILREAILPYLRELGEAWAAGRVTVAQEHFASGTVRSRLLAVGRGWDRGVGPRAVLACPPGELHDLGLIAFGLALRHHGWRITYLGADTPIGSIQNTVSTLQPVVVVMSAVTPERFWDQSTEIHSLARRTSVMVAGAGALREFAESSACHLLDINPVDAAHHVAAEP